VYSIDPRGAVSSQKLMEEYRLQVKVTDRLNDAQREVAVAVR